MKLQVQRKTDEHEGGQQKGDGRSRQELQKLPEEETWFSNGLALVVSPQKSMLIVTNMPR